MTIHHTDQRIERERQSRLDHTLSAAAPVHPYQNIFNTFFDVHMFHCHECDEILG
jgi:hypothetical protein